jgi:hypothetical protein
VIVFLGIDDNTGLVYESVGSSPDRPVIPLPMVSQAKLIDRRSDWDALPASYRSSPLTLLFREDSFDATTRTRRGRLYESMTGASYPDHNARVSPLPFEDMARSHIGPDGKLHRPLNVYAAATSMFELPGRGLGATLALGNRLAASAWRIADVEITVSDDVMLSLRALSAYGVLPALDVAKVDVRFRDEVARSLQRVVDSAFRESAIAVVDQCRDAATLIGSRWVWQLSRDENVLRKDLAKVADALAEEPRKKLVAANMARSIAILHSRGKTNEQFAKALRAPSEDDAEFALHALSLLLRELDWAQIPA